MEGFELVEVTSEATEAEIDQLIRVVQEAVFDDPVMGTRLIGLSDEKKKEYARRYWLLAHIHNSHMRVYGVRDLETS
jgi:hypothetical protein